MNVLIRCTTVLSLTALAGLGLAAPAAALPHVEHPSSANCLGHHISVGAVTGGPRAVAEHQRAVKAELGRAYGPVTATVAKLDSTCQ